MAFNFQDYFKQKQVQGEQPQVVKPQLGGVSPQQLDPHFVASKEQVSSLLTPEDKKQVGVMAAQVLRRMYGGN